MDQTGQGYLCTHCDILYPKMNNIVRFIIDPPEIVSAFPEDEIESTKLVENQHFWFRIRKAIIHEILPKYLPNSSHLIDAGCGTGYLSREMKNIGFNVDCGDLSLNSLEYCATKNSGQNYYQFNVSYPLFSHEFDGYCLFDVLEHINDDITVLKNIHMSLTKEGYLFLIVPGGKAIWTDMDDFTGHYRRYSPEELKMKLESAGFHILRMSYFMSLLYPFMCILSLHSKMMKKDTNRQKNCEISQHYFWKIPSLSINNILYHIFRIEIRLIRWTDLPFGTSILCIAQKGDT